MRMWFGKYKGTQVEDLPDDYLDWLSSIHLTSEKLRLAVEEERQRRLFLEQHKDFVNSKLVNELVSAGVHSLARKYHPDGGGSNQKMKLINVCAGWIKAQAREALS